MKLKVNSYFLDDEGDRFFGEGPYRLLLGIKAEGSLRAAALSMGMAYGKAFSIIKRAEQLLGYPLTRRTIGGRGGGGSELTPEAESLIARYAEFRKELAGSADDLLKKHFPEFSKKKLAAVILAAGKGVRFGGGKLLHPFEGAPLCSYAADAVPKNLLGGTVAVVSDGEVQAVFEEKGIKTVFYEGGPKSESVKRGLSAVTDSEGCIFIPADQPRLRRESVEKLAEAFIGDPLSVWRLGFEGRAGAPVVFPKSLYEPILSLSGERGGMAAVPEGFSVKILSAENADELADADTVEALLELEKRK